MSADTVEIIKLDDGALAREIKAPEPQESSDEYSDEFEEEIEDREEPAEADEPDPEPAPEPTPEEKQAWILRRERTMQLIQEYYIKFPQRLGPLQYNLHECSELDLDTILRTVRVKLSLHGNADIVKFGLYTGLKIAGDLGTRAGLKLKGYDAVIEDRSVGELLDECALKYSDTIALEPEYRLMLTIGNLMASLHKLNTRNEAIIKKREEKAAAEKKVKTSTDKDNVKPPANID